MNNLNKTLRDEAIGLSLCKEWQGMWLEDKSKDELVKFYKKGIDFSIKNNWPTPSFISENFDKDVLHDNMVYCNEDFSLKGDIKGVCVVNGSCNGTIDAEGFSALTIHVRNSSSVEINVNGSSVVFVCLYDNSYADVFCEEGSKVYVKKYGSGCSVKGYGNVKIKRLESYNVR